jgi:hypothetical protein
MLLAGLQLCAHIELICGSSALGSSFVESCSSCLWARVHVYFPLQLGLRFTAVVVCRCSVGRQPGSLQEPSAEVLDGLNGEQHKVVQYCFRQQQLLQPLHAELVSKMPAAAARNEATAMAAVVAAPVQCVQL